MCTPSMTTFYLFFLSSLRPHANPQRNYALSLPSKKSAYMNCCTPWGNTGILFVAWHVVCTFRPLLYKSVKL
ncbi:hypothetical protein BDR07DRAFT_168718 [Suillus spraguei]|nr:hypothetical protein BDR07DRAFT_168718 [Suillus spraguei]